MFICRSCHVAGVWGRFVNNKRQYTHQPNAVRLVIVFSRFVLVFFYPISTFLFFMLFFYLTFILVFVLLTVIWRKNKYNMNVKNTERKRGSNQWTNEWNRNISCWSAEKGKNTHTQTTTTRLTQTHFNERREPTKKVPNQSRADKKNVINQRWEQYLAFSVFCGSVLYIFLHSRLKWFGVVVVAVIAAAVCGWYRNVDDTTNPTNKDNTITIWKTEKQHKLFLLHTIVVSC